MNDLLLGLLLIIPITLGLTLLIRGNVRLGGRSNGSIYATCINCGTMVGDNQVGRSMNNVAGFPILTPGQGGGSCPNCSRRN
jgi:hypothetical protein